MNQAVESYLRPQQKADLVHEKERIAHALKERPDQIQDKSDARRQIRNINHMLETQAAPELSGEALDAAVKRSEELKAKITEAMPSHEEMRKCPPGAIAKHQEWEKANKKNINEWKNLQLALNPESTDPDIANIERLRPHKSTLNMHNAIVEGSQLHGIDTAAPTTVLSSEDIALIKERAPEEVSSRLALMDAEQRAIVKLQYVTDYAEPTKKTLSLKKEK